jgi:prepilin-type N-terminal cleavage/methylation domain-containing protein
MRGKTKGFTLSEVMIVVVIIAITAALAVPNMSGWLATQRLKSATRTVVSHLLQSRMEAIDRNRNVSVVFNVGTETYSVYYMSDGLDIDIVPTQHMPSGVVIDDDATTVTVTGFDSRGFAMQQGNVVLRSTKTGAEKIVTIRVGGSVNAQ